MKNWFYQYNINQSVNYFALFLFCLMAILEIVENNIFGFIFLCDWNFSGVIWAC